jgi:hypothetical protein
LFELCHDGMPVEFMSALAGHGEQGHHDNHEGHGTGGHGSTGSCSVGHILALAFADAPDTPDIPVLPAIGYETKPVTRLELASRRFAYAPRGPPVP